MTHGLSHRATRSSAQPAEPAAWMSSCAAASFDDGRGVTVSAIPEGAVEVAAAAITIIDGGTDKELATAALDAAAPILAAAERARIRALLPYHVPCCPGFYDSVGDLVNEHEDSP